MKRVQKTSKKSHRPVVLITFDPLFRIFFSEPEEILQVLCVTSRCSDV
jgi:hypothetical protein